MRKAMVINALIVKDRELNYIWESIQSRKLILHPYIAPEGFFDFEKFLSTKERVNHFSYGIGNIPGSVK